MVRPEHKLDDDIISILQASAEPLGVLELEECLMPRLMPYLHHARAIRIQRALRRLGAEGWAQRTSQTPCLWALADNTNQIINSLWRK